MVDYASLILSHGLLLLAVWHLLWRDDLDSDPTPPEPETPVAPDPQPAKPVLRLRA